MNFCPSCGAQLEADQNFCRRCGYDIRGRLGASGPPQEATQLAPVYGMDARQLFVLGDEGITSIGTGTWILFLAAIGAFVFVVAMTTSFSDVVVLPTAIALILILLPIVNEFRHRRLASLLRLPRASLLTSEGKASIPWESVSFMSIKGKTLTYEVGGKRCTMAIEASDIPSLSAKAASTLGARFVLLPERRMLSGPTKFLILTLSLFVLTQALLIAASVTPFLPGEEARYSVAVNSTRASISGVPIVEEFGIIFFNNVQVALLSLVPGLGLLTLSASSYNTGRVIQVIALQDGVSPSYLLSFLYMLPHSWVEELCYPLAGALGFYALLEWRRITYKEFSVWWKRERLSLGFAVIAGTLAFAAALEVAEPQLGSYALYLWGPVLVGAYLFIKFRSRLNEIL